MTETSLTRREFLKAAVSTAAAVGIAVACFGVGFGAGYAAASALAPKVKEIVKKVKVPVRIKVGFIYIGPVGDYGWTFGHDRGRRYITERLAPILAEWHGKREPVYVEKVYPEEKVREVIDELVQMEHCDVIFTTSFGYMKYTWEKAREYPDVLFGHCSGYLTPETPLNVCEYFIDLYEAYYLNGIIAGAMTRTNKVGYVPAHLIPEVIRHINAFTIGVKEGAALVGKDPDKVEVIVASPLGEWYAPDKARERAESLIAEGCDVLAYTEDSPAVLMTAEEHQKRGEKIWSFSHYSDMHLYGPHACLSGQLVNWGPLYEEMVIRAYMVKVLMEAGMDRDEALKIWTDWPPERPRDYWWSMHRSHYIDLTLDKAFRVVKELPQGKIYEPINVVDIWPLNPAIPEKVRSYVLLKRKFIIENKVDPFGPPVSIVDKEGKVKRVVLQEIRDTEGKVRVEPGLRLSKDELYNMNWFVEGVIKPRGV